MSFSKAKLKRFNDVPVPVPESPCSERKDHIKKFLKDIKDSCKDSSKDSKEKDSAKESKKILSTPSKSETESVKSSKSMKLFRTPSLPKRLKFRQNTDVTPKKELQKDLIKEKEALEAAQVEIKNKTEVLQDYETQIDDLKVQVFQLKENKTKCSEEIFKKDETIKELTEEISSLKESNLKLKDDEVKLLENSKQLENEIKMLLASHDNELTFLLGTNSEIEMNRDQLLQENKKISEENASLKLEIDSICDEITVLKLTVQASEDNLQTKNIDLEKLAAENMCLLEDIQKLKKQVEEDMLSYTQESQSMLKELSDLKIEKYNLGIELDSKTDLIKALQEELLDKDVEMDLQRDSIRESFQEESNSIAKKYEQQMQTLKEINEMKIKEIESIHMLAMSKINRDHQTQLQSYEKRKTEQIERANESAEEKIRISEIQNEQKVKALELVVEQSIEREKQLWKSEIDKCQKIAETEIIQSEIEKQDLKTLLESAHEMLREREDKVKNLETKITNGIEYYASLSEKFESELNDVKQECARLMTEKYNYQLTLNNTRSTVNIIMERLKKSDTDVETLKSDLENANRTKSDLESRNATLENDMKTLRYEMEDYKTALTTLRNSSQALEREMKEKETIFEKLMSSEEETLETVNKIGKLFNDRIEENIDKYFEMYMELKRKYESRETYIKDMKALLDEFGTGIELARIELDSKDKQLYTLEQENNNIKLENMTYRFKCEQFEKYQPNNETPSNFKLARLINQPEKDMDDKDQLIGNRVIESIMQTLDSSGYESNCDKLSSDIPASEPQKLIEENQKLKVKLAEQIRRNGELQEMIELESESATENAELKKRIEDTENALKTAENLAKETLENYHELKEQTINTQNAKNIENLRETNAHLKSKIQQLQVANKEHETTIKELKDKLNLKTPRKTKGPSTPKTPRTPRTPRSLLTSFAGKENRSPADAMKSPKGPLKPRN